VPDGFAFDPYSQDWFPAGSPILPRVTGHLSWCRTDGVVRAVVAAKEAGVQPVYRMAFYDVWRIQPRQSRPVIFALVEWLGKDIYAVPFHINAGSGGNTGRLPAIQGMAVVAHELRSDERLDVYQVAFQMVEPSAKVVYVLTTHRAPRRVTWAAFSMAGLRHPMTVVEQMASSIRAVLE
jgi:hypothetical protein